VGLERRRVITVRYRVLGCAVCIRIRMRTCAAVRVRVRKGREGSSVVREGRVWQVVPSRGSCVTGLAPQWPFSPYFLRFRHI